MNTQTSPTSHPVILTIAGSDPCSGAGLQADIRVAHAIGCYATNIVTAITSQSTQGVANVWPLTPTQILAQGNILLNDVAPKSIKIGMLANDDVASAVYAVLKHSGCTTIVADTILSATSGKALFDDHSTKAFCKILDSASAITPNLPEAKTLLNGADCEPEEIPLMLSRKFNGVSVYLKGGHGDGATLTDYFYNSHTGKLLPLSSARIDTQNTHGTGCCLSTALASYLALGYSLDEAARNAHDFTHRALERGRDFKLGHGHGPTFSF